jgi:phage-related minor tail protein
MAGGRLGVMGEAGPEAVMPLKRGADGRLGVAGGGGTVVNNYHVAAGVTRNELVTALQMMAQTLTGQTDAKLRRAGIQ